ncbi:MAG: DUF5702 domain-containing protein [Clostridiales bacterium]|nr:DUF5702 domain-containing protein [Clostridiales bacterium]
MKEKLQEAFRCWNQWSHRYVNGTKGAVSIFLAICMIPLLSISALLVESVRYQNAVELLQEILDSAGLSTIANYDSYLEERFGLLAVAQDTDITATMSEYINLNTNALGSSATVDSVSANGAYALSDVDIFEQQILEYAEVSAPVKSLTENLNISEALTELQNKILGEDTAKQLRNIEAMASGTASATEAVTDMLDAVVTLKDKAETYQDSLADYQSKYSTFQEKIQALVEAIKTAEEKVATSAEEGDAETTSDTAEVYDTAEVKEALEAVNSAQKSYKSAASTLKSDFSSYSSAITTSWTKIQSASNSVSKVNSTGVSGTSATVSSSTVDWISETVDDIVSVFETLFGSDYESKAAEIDSALNTQINLLSNSFVATWVDSSWSDTELTSWLKEAGYWPIDTSFTSSSSGVVERLGELASTLAAKTTLDSTTSLSLSSYISLAKNLCGLSGVYDSSLNAEVSSNYNSGAELYASLATASINSILDAGQNLIDAAESLATVSGFKQIIEAIKSVVTALYNLIKGLVELIAGIITFLADMIVQLVALVEMLASGDLGRYYLLAAYSTYNLPNRTNATSGSSLSGYSYKKVAQLNGDGIPSATIAGSLLSYASGESQSVSKSTFYGAELEYLLGGTNSEIGNQTAVFMALYIERFILNIGTVFSDGDVQLQASLAGPASWVVYVVLMIAEPLVDTLLLVNGGNIYLIKNFVYMTPTGMYQMLQDLLSCADITTQQETQLRDNINKAANSKLLDYKDMSFDGIMKMKYEEHAMLLLMLTVDKDTLLKRLQNIVQMESAAYYSGIGFALTQAYTTVYADVTFTLNPMLNLDTLTANGLFRFHQTGYFGY